MKHLLRPLPLALSLLITACATAPLPDQAHPTTVEPPVATTTEPAAQAPAAPVATADTTVWERLRDSFAMPGCSADPEVQTWAHRYTRSPKRFEARMRAILPRLVYVQDSAARHGVAGEFALLPWVESHFKPVPPRKNRAAGMWQIMPGTARQMGLRITHGYDGRLDLPAATEAVMALLSHYHDWFQDWRLADYAYNAGRYGIDRLLAREGAPAAEPALPTLPVRAGTRQHLVKLLAIACVVREPARFHVTLPTLDDDQRLVVVDINRRVSLSKAARQAGLPLATLKDLNAGYRDGMVGGHPDSHLLLPRRQADQLRTALLAQAVAPGSDRVASVSAAPALPDLDNHDTPPTRRPEHIPATPSPAASGDAQATRHVVHSGDTLFEIARRYRVRVAQLKRWNHLRGDTIRVGQKLLVSAPR